MLSLRRHARGLGLSPRRSAAPGSALSVVQDGAIAERRLHEGAGQTLADDTGADPGYDSSLPPGEVEQNRQAPEVIVAPSGTALT